MGRQGIVLQNGEGHVGARKAQHAVLGRDAVVLEGCIQGLQGVADQGVERCLPEGLKVALQVGFGSLQGRAVMRVHWQEWG